MRMRAYPLSDVRGCWNGILQVLERYPESAIAMCFGIRCDGMQPPLERYQSRFLRSICLFVDQFAITPLRLRRRFCGLPFKP